jgi:multidrug efflux pump
VIVQADAPDRMQPDDLLQLNVVNNQGKPVPMAAMATTRWVTGPIQTIRFNGYPTMRISGDAGPGYSTGDAMNEMERLAGQLPAGFAFEWTGQSREERLSGSTATILLAFSLLAVFLALSALYESWSIPLAVLLAVPLGVLGAVIGASLRGMPNDVFFKVGLITVIGLSAKNAVLIIEFAKDLQAEGMGLIEATLEAVHLRVRPIIMTSLAFILGVLPLVFSTGAGAGARHSAGTGVMGGMLAATFLAIFFVPMFFKLMTDRHLTEKRSTREIKAEAAHARGATHTTTPHVPHHAPLPRD